MVLAKVVFRLCFWFGSIILGEWREPFLNAANELCQVAKLHEAALPISSAMAINSRYSKSKTLLVRISRLEITRTVPQKYQLS